MFYLICDFICLNSFLEFLFVLGNALFVCVLFVFENVVSCFLGMVLFVL